MNNGAKLIEENVIEKLVVKSHSRRRLNFCG